MKGMMIRASDRSKLTKVPCAYATTVAAVNAIVNHLQLGQFLAEFNLDMDPLTVSTDAGVRTYCHFFLYGRTNTGNYISGLGMVCYKFPPWDKEDFPIHAVHMNVERRSDPKTEGCGWGDSDRYTCRFDSGIRVLDGVFLKD